MDQWFYAENGSQQGPVDRSVLLQMLASGQLPAESMVWREGMADWAPAKSLPELMSAGGHVQSANQPLLNYGVADSAYVPLNLQMAYAGFWIRFCGAFVDGIVLFVVNRLILAIVTPMIVIAGAATNMRAEVLGLHWTIGTAIGWLYVATMQSSTLQATLGQMATGLRVTDLQGRGITFARATGRYFCTILSAIILYIGYLMVIWTARKQALHDIIAGTLVLRKQPPMPA